MNPFIFQDLERRLSDLLAADAEIRITPAREAGRHNLWVVGEGASDAVAEVIAALPALNDLLSGVQAYESREEAARYGFEPSSAERRTDWLSRVQAAPTPIELEPSFEPPIIVTFYSFRGGVGRTTALAHTAAVLAERGRRVVVVDADLEAPGLHHAFGVDAVTDRSDTPLLDLLARLQDGGESPVDPREYLVQVPAYPNLYLLPAGDAGPDYLASLDRLNFRSWTLASGNPVEAAIDLVANSTLEPDIVLVDARTGLTDTNAPFLFGGCDHVVVVFFPSQQSRAGADVVARALATARSRRGSPVGLHFIASPVPSGKGTALDASIVERAQQWATDWVSTPEGDVTDPDFVAVPYAEALALADRVTSDETLREPYVSVADWFDTYESQRTEEDQTAEIRQQLTFTAGNSDASDEDILSLFVRTEDAERVRDSRILLVEGRKGTGKTTLFRWLCDDRGAIPITSPESLRTQTWWPTRAVWANLAEIDSGFGRTWPTLIALRAAESVPAVGEANPDLAALLERVQTAGVLGLGSVIQEDDGSVANELGATDLMVRALSALPGEQRLVFDGLDTTFGYGLAERRLRDAAIGALLPLLMDREASLPSITFTVFVRTDIVRGISFANQSHLFGRRLTLSWDKEDYLKTVLKQALTSSPTFARSAGVAASEVDDLTDDQTLSVWYALLGVRMRGKQTAFTDRWVWTRLADGNGDHSPRHLAQLFRELASRARTRPPEAGPPLRARDLGAALSESVSQEAVTALRDEFAEEASAVLPVFGNLDQSPLSREEWASAGGDGEQLALAETMGLVAQHPRDRDRLVVPELYRYALGVRRRGPA